MFGSIKSYRDKCHVVKLLTAKTLEGREMSFPFPLFGLFYKEN